MWRRIIDRGERAGRGEIVDSGISDFCPVNGMQKKNRWGLRVGLTLMGKLAMKFRTPLSLSALVLLRLSSLLDTLLCSFASTVSKISDLIPI